MAGSRSYLVTWQMDIEADNPVEAAQLARHYQTKPDTTATVFDVLEMDGNGDAVRIDLTELAEEAAAQENLN